MGPNVKKGLYKREGRKIKGGNVMMEAEVGV